MPPTLSKPQSNDDYTAEGVSLCIPSVFANITSRRVKRVFIGLNWGFVERVDMVPLGDFQRVFVHFAPGRWNMHNKQARQVLAALKKEEDVKVYYESDPENPWFWKVSLSRSKKPAEGRRPPEPARVRIGTAAATNSSKGLWEPRSKSSPPAAKDSDTESEGTAASDGSAAAAPVAETPTPCIALRPSWANIAGAPRKKLRMVQRKR